MLISDRYYAGNTALHLAAMHSQPVALIPLVLDKRINLFVLKHECLTALDIAQYRIRREYTLRKQLTVTVLKSTSFGKGSAVNADLFALRAEARDEALTLFDAHEKKPTMDHVKDAINTRLLVATPVATMTFASGFAVPGGFNGSDMASKDDQGMATMLDKKMFQAFVICSTIAMFCSMIAAVNLIWAQQNNVYMAIAAYQHTILSLKIAIPVMSAAFLTGITLTVGNSLGLLTPYFYLGLVFLRIISGAKSLRVPSSPSEP
ncbi:hypothetical protein ACJRO7_006539 [Eucalyptus globulus]|uniref:PGG domain-containing protein n=1 Tax=Eucalyptus globulus TaxID=34317 RepID=A0ABD3IMJ5_EUCGL